jgi:hypothetical protein
MPRNHQCLGGACALSGRWENDNVDWTFLDLEKKKTALKQFGHELEVNSRSHFRNDCSDPIAPAKNCRGHQTGDPAFL